MKTELASKSDNKFKPITISITFETQKELDAFGALTNASPILDALHEINGKLPEFQFMQSIGADIDMADEFVKKLMETPYVAINYKKK